MLTEILCHFQNFWRQKFCVPYVPEFLEQRYFVHTEILCFITEILEVQVPLTLDTAPWFLQKLLCVGSRDYGYSIIGPTGILGTYPEFIILFFKK